MAPRVCTGHKRQATDRLSVTRARSAEGPTEPPAAHLDRPPPL